jgi:hypothetical protein
VCSSDLGEPRLWHLPSQNITTEPLKFHCNHL